MIELLLCHDCETCGGNHQGVALYKAILNEVEVGVNLVQELQKLFIDLGFQFVKLFLQTPLRGSHHALDILLVGVSAIVAQGLLHILGELADAHELMLAVQLINARNTAESFPHAFILHAEHYDGVILMGGSPVAECNLHLTNIYIKSLILSQYNKF